MTMLTSKYWRVEHIRDEIIETGGARVNIDLLHRVLLARQSADHRLTTGKTPRPETVTR